MSLLAGSTLSGCGEKGRAQPVRSRFFCFTDGLFDFKEFVWTETYSHKLTQGFSLRFLWSANFSRHTGIVSVSQKYCLHKDSFCGTDIQVSNETLLSPKEMAGTAAGESELTSSQPVEAGASRRESEMNAEPFQAGNSDRQFRCLAIEAVGDFFRGQTKPLIRLRGNWLAQAGFRPGHRVQIQIEQPGSLTLRCLEQGSEAAL